MPPKFIYFDLGNVLLYFSHERQAAQMARVTGIDSKLAWQILYGDGLHWDYERGDVSEDQFYTQFCQRAAASADRAALAQASNDIFELNVQLVALLGHILAAGYPLGILSNTTESHWRYCTSRYSILSLVPVYALSFRLRVMKPDPQIYTAAAQLAGVPPQDIFFTDDRPEHIAAARAAGWDALQFESASQINTHLRNRGIIINY